IAETQIVAKLVFLEPHRHVRDVAYRGCFLVRNAEIAHHIIDVVLVWRAKTSAVFGQCQACDNLIEGLALTDGKGLITCGGGGFRTFVNMHARYREDVLRKYRKG